MRGNASSNFRRQPHILFIDDFNSSRSQMAEAFMRQEANDLVEVQSAGIQSEPLDRRAIQVMREINIDMRFQQEKVITREILLWADVTIVISDPKETLSPPIPPSAAEKHWLISKPHFDSDSDDLKAYREVRDLIRQRVDALVKSMRLFYGRSRPAARN